MSKSPKPQKSINVVAGPNGSGKTTFAKSFLTRDKSVSVFLNPDLIAAGISPHSDDQASFQAGRVLLTDIKNRLADGESFGFESTLSGKTYAALLRIARAHGYHITIHFIFVDSVSLSLKRIKTRVSQGGHNIPKKAVLRRQLRCFKNFWNLYRPLSDEWNILNNSGAVPKYVLDKNEFDSWGLDAQEKFSSLFLKGRVNVAKRAKK